MFLWGLEEYVWGNASSIKEKHTANIQKNEVKIKLTEPIEYMGVGKKENYNFTDKGKIIWRKISKSRHCGKYHKGYSGWELWRTIKMNEKKGNYKVKYRNKTIIFDIR